MLTVGRPTPFVAGALTLVLVLSASACQSRTASSEETPAAEPEAGTWATWILESPSEVAVPPPPEPGTPDAEADAAGLRAAAEGRDEETTSEVDKWDADPAVAPWMELALDFIANRSKDPVAASRSYALVAVAMYDAVVATWHYKDTYDRPGPDSEGALVGAEPDPSYPSGHAAIAGAASTVLAYAFPEQPALRLAAMAEEAAQSRVVAGVSYPSDVEAGLALGRTVGDLVLERAQAEVVTDGDLTQREGVENWEEMRPDGDLLWRQPPGSVQVPVSPMAGTWDTWVLESGDQFRPGPFPDVESEEFRAEVMEVVETKENLTEEQKRIAEFWEGGEGTALPPGIWNEVALAFLSREDVNLPRAARAMALLNVAMDDAGVAAWDTKYTYWGPRPDTAVRDLGIDPDWEPYLATPIFPGYVSGHGAYSGAAQMVLSHLFPDRAQLFEDRAEEASVSRLYGGIHIRSDNEVALDMGRKVGALVVDYAERDGADS